MSALQKAKKNLAKRAGKKAKPTVELIAWGGGKSLSSALSKRKKKQKKEKKMRGVPRDITVSAPVSKRTTYNARKPIINGSRADVVVHREYLQKIVTVTSFTGAGRYIIQPGLSDNFPWLAQQAQSYENYRFRSIRYVYRNQIATNASGAIYMGVQYDVSDPEFKSVEEIMNYAGAREDVIYRKWTYDIHPKRGQLSKKYMVRTDVLPEGLDPTLFDTALFTICCVSNDPNLPAGSYVGDLSVEYEIEFTNPKMNPNLVSAAGCWSVNNVTGLSSFCAQPLQGMTGDAIVNVGFSSDNQPVIESKSTGSIMFPVPGAYNVRYNVENFSGTGTLTGQGFDPVNAGDFVYSEAEVGASSGAGKGFVQFVSLVSLVPKAVMAIDAILGTGTSSTAIISTLTVACEATNFMLEYLLGGPTPPLTKKGVPFTDIKTLQRVFPKTNFSKFRARLGMIDEMRMAKRVSEILLEEKERKALSIAEKYSLSSERRSVSRQRRVVSDQDEEALGEPLVREESQLRPVDKRSKSSERKES